MSYKNLRTIPVYMKSLALCKMSREIAAYVSYNKDFLKLYQSNSLRDNIADALITDAILIPQNIAQAECSESYATRLRSVRFINTITQNILSYCNGLEKDGVKEKEYLNLLRNEVNGFRKSFISWKKSIQSNDGSSMG
ncbi:hypothetical protein [Spongiimicrobium salis]|uniref:hypothetical protein n=1 Tax=Spongiimicrobium salis TaxID=1667022 RepID=UPI00374CA9F0